MSQTAARLVDHVILHVPVRQWVRVCQLQLPIPLRVLLAAQPELVTPVLQVVQRVVERRLLDHTGLKSDEGQGGAVTLIQRFGSAANLNIHLHGLGLDGVYRCDANGSPSFVEADAPTDEELHTLLHTVITRLMKMLTRRGVLVEDLGQTWLAEPDVEGWEARTLRLLQAASITYRIAFGPRAGQKVLTLRGTMSREATARQPLCADIDGFSLHAAVRFEAEPGRGAAPAGCLTPGEGREFCERAACKATTASGWSSCVATSPGRRCPMSGCSSMRQVRWS